MCYKVNMRSIGIRELRQHASRFLQLVRAGHTVRITDRGRPVALLVPIPDSGGVDSLVESGRARPARGDVLDLGAPPPPAKGASLPSDTLAEARRRER